MAVVAQIGATRHAINDRMAFIADTGTLVIVVQIFNGQGTVVRRVSGPVDSEDVVRRG